MHLYHSRFGTIHKNINGTRWNRSIHSQMEEWFEIDGKQFKPSQHNDQLMFVSRSWFLGLLNSLRTTLVLIMPFICEVLGQIEQCKTMSCRTNSIEMPPPLELHTGINMFLQHQEGTIQENQFHVCQPTLNSQDFISLLV